MRLSYETKAQLVPCYVFGGTDFFHTLATSDSLLSRLSRKMKAGLTIFWGQFYLPIPFPAKVTMVLGDPIPLPEGISDSKEAVKILHEKFLGEMTALFDRYKGAVGQPDATLEIH